MKSGKNKNPSTICRFYFELLGIWNSPKGIFFGSHKCATLHQFNRFVSFLVFEISMVRESNMNYHSINITIGSDMCQITASTSLNYLRKHSTIWGIFLGVLLVFKKSIPYQTSAIHYSLSTEPSNAVNRTLSLRDLSLGKHWQKCNYLCNYLNR